MSKLKDKYFDEINVGLEVTRLQKSLCEIKTTDISPVYIIKQALTEFRLSEKEITNVVRNHFKF